MNPKKASELIPVVAEKLGKDAKFVEDLIEFYWKSVRGAISEYKHPYLYLNGLGTFRIKPWKLPLVITKYENTINKYKSKITDGDKVNFMQFSILKEKEQTLAKLLEMKQIIEQEEQEKKSIKEQRHAEKIKDNLEE